MREVSKCTSCTYECEAHVLCLHHPELSYIRTHLACLHAPTLCAELRLPTEQMVATCQTAHRVQDFVALASPQAAGEQGPVH